MNTTCKFCKKVHETPRSRASHEKKCDLNPNKLPNGMLGKKGSNQYLKAEELGLPKPVFSDESKAKVSAGNKGKKHTDEFRKRMSDHAYRRELGGHLSKKRIHYKKTNGEIVVLHSSFETRFAQLLDKFDIEWERPKPLKWISADGKSHRYYPDFKVGEIYIDTKNPYLMIVDADKISKVIEQNNVDLRVIGEDKISDEFVLGLI